MMIFYSACDGNGTDSVRNILKNHSTEITLIDGSTCTGWDHAVADAPFKQGDTLIVDTISALAATYIREYRFRNMKEGEYFTEFIKNWDKTSSQSAYLMAEQTIMQRIKWAQHKGVNIIVTAHEGKQIDEKTKDEWTGPELSPKFFNRLSESCSMMFRLKIEYVQAADENGKVTTKEKRILMIRPVEDYILKCHVPVEELDKIPFRIANPTLLKVYDKLGFTPSFMVLYGPPGTGKTTLSLSQFLGETK